MTKKREREVTPIGTYMSDEYQTPLEWLDRFGEILDGIDLDPCWSEVPGHRYEPFAKVTWGLADKALEKPIEEWQAFSTIYMNPPYSKPRPWIDKLIACTESRWIALANGQVCAQWWHKAAEAASVIAFPKSRISFVDPRTGKIADGNRYDQTIFVKADPGLAFDVLDSVCFCTFGGRETW